MQVETTKMDPRIAKVHWQEYRDRLRRNREERKKEIDARGKKAGRELGRVRIEKTQLEKEDEELKKVYWQLSRGQTVLHLPRVVGQAGLDSQRLPKLAVCRADIKWCEMRTGGDYLAFTDADAWSSSKANSVHVQERFFKDNGFACLTDYSWRNENKYPRISSVRALVPSIPPNLRPDGDISKYHILWEAEWKKAPPKDPILLSKVTDTIYIVVAQWDLTEVEQMVLDGRFS